MADQDEGAVGRLGALRAAWTRAWPQAWVDPARRAAMIDLHAWLHAVSLVVDDGLAGTSCVLPSVADLAVAVVGDALPTVVLEGPVVPVMAMQGRPSLRAERSRPAWLLSGVADDVPWAGGVSALVVLAVDEGDNEVVALVDVNAPGVRVVHRAGGSTSVHLDEVAVSEPRLAHRPEARAALADRMTVLRLARAIARADGGQARVDLELCGAATHAAAVSALSASTRPLTRQHDVSAAAVVTLSTLGASHEHGRTADDLAWHRERLAPLV
ncbi:hypothetical protein IFT73_01785 [Aeromicrobium sp. CFBP 8757]|uniref:hypothetical protein n=1 Tax=Aeromicrobium sp. CFBP 8757 TaxID=2775288 RepID=UPI001784659F|nr:hypothetical protein [Aeromicrobium sp. CFBP 8757]MBD8605573.1 hypothetical protein [Aeromicrobium sp. CFBP 8757]